MAGAGNEKDVEAARPDDPVQVQIDEVEPRHRSEMTEQARLDMRHGERLAKQRVIEQIDLTDRQLIGGAPPSLHDVDLVRRQRFGLRLIDGVNVQGMDP